MKTDLMGLDVTDTVTGFKGVVTAIIEYMDGEQQCNVQPKCEDNKKYPKARWFRNKRLSWD